VGGWLIAHSEAGRLRLFHELEEYAAFIALLMALYVIAGGIVVLGDLAGRPSTNASILALGAVLANFIGTTGASMILIRPLLRINAERLNKSHLPIFFIFMVSNTGGLLTPLGDPPLFLGFLKGVDFFWTLTLWKEWLLVNAVLLLVFYLWDSRAYARETPQTIVREETRIHPIRVGGMIFNGPLLLAVLLTVMFQSESFGKEAGELLASIGVNIGNMTLSKEGGIGILLGLAAISYIFTPKHQHLLNQFSWGPMLEVVILFLGIFVTMVPALALLEIHGQRFGITRPWEFFWLTGMLSSFLDNAPTYLTFGTLAAGGDSFDGLQKTQPLLLQAISCGAVFMGANTYIGNGPNFMVKAIAESHGYRMPSFFGYMAYSFGILLPIFVLVTFVFFANS
jgi:Na+/H+ antiporter NhaD/arsenite permease-like protein